MTARRRQLRDAAICFVAAALIFAPAVSAQEDPIVIGQREQPPMFHLEPPDVTLTLDAYYSRGTIDQGGIRRRFTQYRFDEVLTLSTIGHIVHPDVVDLDLSGSFGLSQGRARNNGVAVSDRVSLYEFDAAATFFRDRGAPLRLYGQRTRSLMHRTFGPTLENTLTTYGAASNFHLGLSHHRMDVYRTSIRQDSFTGDLDFALDQNAFLWSGRAPINDNQTLTWDYSYTDVQQSRLLLDTRFHAHDARITHSLSFGPEDRHSLTSSLRYFDQSGDIQISSFRWDETLRLRHTDRFETHYRYTYEQRSVAGFDRTRHRGSAGFRHRLYDSLFTTGNLGYQRLDTPNARSDELFGNLDFDYRKIVPLGRFSAGMGLGHSRLESESRLDPVPIIGDTRTFEDSLPIVLVGPNIVTESILLMDPTGLIIYTPGVDYFVTAFPDRVEIRRIVGGRLDAGDAVRLDYLLAPQPGHVTTTNTLSLRVRYDLDETQLKGLGVYGRFFTQNQQIDTDVPAAFIPNDFRDVIVGVDYTRGGLFLSAERQWRIGEVLPFEATRYTARYRQPIAIDTTLTLGTAYSIIDYTAIDSRVTLLTASGQVHHDFNRRLRGVATVLWRDERSDRFGRTHGFEQQGELQWRHRQTDLYVRVRNAVLQSPLRDMDFQFIQIGLRREF